MQRTDIPSLKAEETLKRAEALDVPEEIRQQIFGHVDDVNVGTRLWIAGLLPLGTHAEQAPPSAASAGVATIRPCGMFPQLVSH